MEIYRDKTRSALERATALVDEMTVKEMIEQLRYDAPAIERLGVPAYNWWNEGLHGVARAGLATMFPQAIAMAATFDPSLVYEAGCVTGIECRLKHREFARHGDRNIYKGLTLWAPNINIFRDPRWGRGHETYGEDPYLTARMGVSYVRGIQGDGGTMQAAACAKHFAVHSGPEQERHSFNAVASPKDMNETYLYAFEKLVKEAKVEGVMGAYNRVNGEVACGSDFLMGKLREWGFDGYFTSDCWAIRDFNEGHKITKDQTESAAYALRKGCDVNCGCSYRNLDRAYQKKMVSKDDLRRACIHLMRTRIRLGLFDDDTGFEEIPYTKVSCPEHKALSRKIAEKSAVLLKNDGILPLSGAYRTLAVIGPNADSVSVLEGNYKGTADRYRTFLEGIGDRFDGRVLYTRGCPLCRTMLEDCSVDHDGITEAIVCAEQADAVILCVGLDSIIEGEESDKNNPYTGDDKTDLLLPKPQRELVKRVLAVGKPTVVVLTGGSAINIEAKPNALIDVFYPGSEGGDALAAILFGDVSPSGKLPVTFYEDVARLPDYRDYSMENRTYRYTRENVLYPFGYGLSYAKVVPTAAKYEDGQVRVTFENQSDRATDEVAEVYIKGDTAAGAKYPNLAAMKRFEIKANETVELTVPIDEEAFTAVDENGTRARFAETFTLYVGTHAPDEKSITLSGTDVITLKI